MATTESERRAGRRIPFAVAGRLCDILIPGLGMLLTGRAGIGWAAIVGWALAIVSVASSICLLGLHPLRGLMVLGALYAAIEALLAMAPQGLDNGILPMRAFKGAVVFAALLAACSGLIIRPWCTALRVADLCEYPGLVPGEVVLMRRTEPSKDPPKPGELVAAQTDDGHVMIARVAGMQGDRIDLSGPTLKINDAVVESEALGTVRMPEGEDPLPEETRSLRVYREVLGGVGHMFFFSSGVVMAPSSHEVPKGSVFLLCDNRSTAQSTDSRAVGAVSTDSILGIPGMIIWSSTPNGRIRLDRIGAVWK
ncbi:MAG: signal peptidase I [Deltaproteobacteria bacterium]|nr:signal peptidase I [Deltaproteobacteria bacterium]